MIQQLWRVLCWATSLPEYILTVVLILAGLEDVEVGTRDERAKCPRLVPESEMAGTRFGPVSAEARPGR